jgi:hypothetical protein
VSEIKIKILRLTDDEEKNANSVLHAAIYARYSSIGNSPYSADEQIQRIRYRVESGQIRSRRFPDAKIIIDEKWVIKDEAKTGRVTNSGLDLVRQGTQAKKFNMVLGDDWSRFARDLGGLIDLYDDFVFYQVE